MGLFNICPAAFGLNITDAGIWAVQLKKIKSGFALAGFFRKDIEKGIVKDGEIINKEKLVSYLKIILRKKEGGGINTRNVVFSLPEFKTFLQTVDIPANLNSAEMAEAVRWEAESSIPIPIEEVYMDWKIIPGYSDGGNKIFLSSAPKKLVDSYAEALRDAGLNAAAAEMESIALARVALKEKMNDEKAALIINIGKEGTIFVIAHKNVVRFTSSNAQNNLDFVVEDARRALEFAREHVIRSENIDIILGGDGNDLQYFSQIISKKLKADVYINNPWHKIKKTKSQEKLISSQCALTALGLAERAAQLNL